MKVSKAAIDKVSAETNSNSDRLRRSTTQNPYKMKTKSASKVKLPSSSPTSTGSRRSCRNESNIHSPSTSKFCENSDTKKGSKCDFVCTVTPESSVDTKALDASTASGKVM